MNVTARHFTALLLLQAFSLSSAAQAGNRVDLELAVEERVPITGRQEWLRRLSQAGVEGFRIRSAHLGDEPKVQRRGTAEAPSYAVTGIITSDNILVVPGARFQASQVSQFAAWLRDLSEMGPVDERPAKAAFGLTVEDLERLQADLAPPLGFNTAGMSRADVIRQAAKKMATPLAADPRLAEPLSKDVVAEDLSTLSRGTALAYVLRSPGLCLVPRAEPGRVSLSIVEARSDMQIWPIGWEPEKPGREVKPEMFELLNVNVNGVPVTTALDAIAKRLELPILLDHNAVARFGLEPDKAIVKLPPSRWTYSATLSKALFQARLKSELRIDDADRPFLWVTSLKDM
jgi:hypothetical protein